MEKQALILLFMSLPIAATLLGMAIVVALLARAHRRVRYRHVTDPTDDGAGGRTELSGHCGRCGYIICAGAAWAFPECGASLREVGVLTPGMLPPAYPAATLVTIIAILAPLAAIGGVVAAQWQPFGWRYSAWKARNAVVYGSIEPGAQATITIESWGRGRWLGHELEHLQISCNQGYVNGSARRPAGMVVDPNWRAAGRAVPADERALLDGLATSGFDPAHADTQVLARELVQDLSDFANFDFPPDITMEERLGQKEGVRYEVHPFIAMALALMLWTAMTVMIMRLFARVHARRQGKWSHAVGHWCARLGLSDPETRRPARALPPTPITAAGGAR